MLGDSAALPEATFHFQSGRMVPPIVRVGAWLVPVIAIGHFHPPYAFRIPPCHLRFLRLLRCSLGFGIKPGTASIPQFRKKHFIFSQWKQ